VTLKLSRFAVPLPIMLCRSLSFELRHVGVETIETLFPDVPIVVRPVRHVLQRCGVDLTVPELRFTPARDQAGLFEDAQMLGDGRHAHVERLGKLGHRTIAVDKPREDGAARRIGEGGEGGAQLVSRHVIEPQS